MPTSLDRIQCLLQPEPYASIRTLAKAERKSLSHMASELLDDALKLPKYKEALEKAKGEGATVPTKEDPRTTIRQRQRRSDEYIAEHLEGDVNKSSTMEPARMTRKRSSATKQTTMPTLRPVLDHKGYLMKDKYGNVLLENVHDSLNQKDDGDEQAREFEAEALDRVKPKNIIDDETQAKLDRIEELSKLLLTL